MKKYAILSFLLLSAATLFSQTSDHLNCFAVLAGKGATTDGSVLLAHNEDDSGEQMLNIYNVPRNSMGKNNKYIWVEFPGMEVSDAYLNEYGVAIHVKRGRIIQMAEFCMRCVPWLPSRPVLPAMLQNLSGR